MLRRVPPEFQSRNPPAIASRPLALPNRSFPLPQTLPAAFVTLRTHRVRPNEHHPRTISPRSPAVGHAEAAGNSSPERSTGSDRSVPLDEWRGSTQLRRRSVSKLETTQLRQTDQPRVSALSQWTAAV